MTPSRARVVRGRATAQHVARYFREHGWPWAQARTGAMTGQDIDNMPGLSPEVKATSDVPLLAALRQAQRNAGGAMPFVIWRPNGFGPERIGEWVAAFTLADATALLAEAGYGDNGAHAEWNCPNCGATTTRARMSDKGATA